MDNKTREVRDRVWDHIITEDDLDGQQNNGSVGSDV